MTSLTRLLPAEVESCYNASPEQAVQCTALLLALGAHQLRIQHCTVAMRSRAEGSQGILNSPDLSRAQLQSPGFKWVNGRNVLLMSKMRSTTDRFCPVGRRGHAKAMKLYSEGNYKESWEREIRTTGVLRGRAKVSGGAAAAAAAAGVRGGPAC